MKKQPTRKTDRKSLSTSPVGKQQSMKKTGEDDKDYVYFVSFVDEREVLSDFGHNINERISSDEWN